MTRTMYDGIGADAFVIKAHYTPGNLVCWYAAGNSFIWTAQEKALFRSQDLVSITLTASYLGADVLDVEAGGATPNQVHGWIAGKKSLGYARPTVYCSLSVVPQIRAATGTYVLGVDYDIWVADWDGSTSLPFAHVAAKQYRDAGPFDLSAVYDDKWPHRTAVTPPPPTQVKSVAIKGGIIKNVPQEADHLVIVPYAIVHGKPVRLQSWDVPTPN